MRAIIIVGVIDVRLLSKYSWVKMERALKEAFGSDTEVSVEHLFYVSWQKRRIVSFASSILKKYDTGEELLLIGHSFGGLIACAIADRFRKSCVRAVVTIFSAHQFAGRALQPYPAKPKVPVLSFSALFDWVVPWGARHPHAVSHEVVFTDHFMFPAFWPGPWRHVARATKAALDGLDSL